MNTPRTKPLGTTAEHAAASAVNCVPIRSASFVSLLVHAAICREYGLPPADYFLWNDDFEFTSRILRRNRGLLCPASVVEHRTVKFGATDAEPGDRFWYEVRNKVWLLTRSNSLRPHERLLYGAATVRRWAGTFARSSHRRDLARSLVGGLVAGLRSGPRPTERVLADVTVSMLPLSESRS